jgi:hypothetical protein
MLIAVAGGKLQGVEAVYLAQEAGFQIIIIDKATDFSSWFSTIKIPDNTIVQQFLDGDSFSIEVLGQPGSYQALQVTDLGMAKDYDCKKVTAPTRLSQQQVKKFKEMAGCHCPGCNIAISKISRLLLLIIMTSLRL